MCKNLPTLLSQSQINEICSSRSLLFLRAMIIVRLEMLHNNNLLVRTHLKLVSQIMNSIFRNTCKSKIQSLEVSKNHQKSIIKWHLRSNTFTIVLTNSDQLKTRSPKRINHKAKTNKLKSNLLLVQTSIKTKNIKLLYQLLCQVLLLWHKHLKFSNSNHKINLNNRSSQPFQLKLLHQTNQINPKTSIVL